MAEKFRLQFRLYDGSTPPEMTIDASEMGLFSICHNLFSVAEAQGWKGEIVITKIDKYLELKNEKHCQD